MYTYILFPSHTKNRHRHRHIDLNMDKTVCKYLHINIHTYMYLHIQQHTCNTHIHKVKIRLKLTIQANLIRQEIVLYFRSSHVSFQGKTKFLFQEKDQFCFSRRARCNRQHSILPYLHRDRNRRCHRPSLPSFHTLPTRC